MLLNDNFILKPWLVKEKREMNTKTAFEIKHINTIAEPNNNNNNNNLYSCPEITQCRQIQKIKNYNRKEHSHLEIAKLIELSGWAKRKKNLLIHLLNIEQ